MAIQRKTDAAPGPSLPAEFLDHAKKGFSLQAIASRYEADFKEEKAWLLKFLESTAEMKAKVGEAVKTPFGSVIISERSNWKIDKELLGALVKSGAITIETLLEISTVSAEKLKDVLGEKKFKLLAENKPTEYLSMTATAEFKAHVEASFGAVVASVESTEVGEALGRVDEVKAKVAAVTVDAKAVAKLAKEMSAKAKERLPAAKAAPETDLDAILKG